MRIEPPGRRERKRASTLDLLANTAYGLFEKHGYEQVTMEQIAVQADVAKGTLYNHFSTKEAVLAHWIHAQLAKDLQHLQADCERRSGFLAKLMVILDASAQWCEQHRVYLGPYLRFRFLAIGSPDTEESDGSDMVTAFAFLIEQGQHSGELRDHLPAAHLAFLLNHLYLGALMRWLTQPGLKLQKEFSAAARLFVEGTVKNTRRPS
jgi:AcrR family transcriptional regulator